MHVAIRCGVCARAVLTVNSSFPAATATSDNMREQADAVTIVTVRQCHPRKPCTSCVSPAPAPRRTPAGVRRKNSWRNLNLSTGTPGAPAVRIRSDDESIGKYQKIVKATNASSSGVETCEQTYRWEIVRDRNNTSLCCSCALLEQTHTPDCRHTSWETHGHQAVSRGWLRNLGLSEIPAQTAYRVGRNRLPTTGSRVWALQCIPKNKIKIKIMNILVKQVNPHKLLNCALDSSTNPLRALT